MRGARKIEIIRKQNPAFADYLASLSQEELAKIEVVTEKNYPKLLAQLQDYSERLGLPQPPTLVLCRDYYSSAALAYHNAIVLEKRFRSKNDEEQTRERNFTIGHELAHIKYPPNEQRINAFASVTSIACGSLNAFFLFPLLQAGIDPVLVSRFCIHSGLCAGPIAARLYYNVESYFMELKADEVAARLTGDYDIACKSMEQVQKEQKKFSLMRRFSNWLDDQAGSPHPSYRRRIENLRKHEKSKNANSSKDR